MKKILIIQSSARGSPPWIRQCQHTVELWCARHGHEYIHFGDSLFLFAPEYAEPFTKVQRSDVARLRIIESQLCTGYYSAVYWLDIDFIIWDIHSFALPMPTPGSVVCARELYRTKRCASVLLNNSVLGFCRREDARVLSDLTVAALAPWKNGTVTPPHIVAGPAVLSKTRFPLRRIIAKQAGCFSDFTIDSILGPWFSGRRHLFWLSVASGATLKAANLCSSRERDDARMFRLVTNLIEGSDTEIGGWRHISCIYRLLVQLQSLPFRVQCWAQTRYRVIRQSLTHAW